MRRCANLPLITIGSGGSSTAAHFAAAVHTRAFGQVARPMTPLEAASSIRRPAAVATMLFTAGGGNPDVLGVFRRLLRVEPQLLQVICARPGSPLEQLASRYEFVDFFSFEVPFGRDGFLATNSLLATCSLLLRAFAAASPGAVHEVTSFRYLLPKRLQLRQYQDELCAQTQPLWARPHLSVIYSTETEPGAVDLESRFIEAALGSIQTADLRQFAHGRHHWLAKRGRETAVLLLTTRRDRALTAKTAQLLPSDVPVVHLELEGDGSAAALSSIVVSMLVAGVAGVARGIDPGRPGVPLFGQKIYNLRAFSNGRVGHVAQLRIERKCQRNIGDLPARDASRWKRSYAMFIARLTESQFSAVVLDYDGTLCSSGERFQGIRSSVAYELTRLLRGGLLLGIATGRGKSVRADLQEKVPRQYWDMMLIGYYNGGDIAKLSDNDRPNAASPSGEFGRVAAVLSKHATLKRIAKVEPRPAQITIEPLDAVAPSLVYEAVGRVLLQHGACGTVTVRSSHSIDVLAPGVSKLLLVKALQQQLAHDAQILCVGDSGNWPGNDSALLATKFSLSCDAVSSDPDTCWNLAPTGYRGVQATMTYLKALRLMKRRKAARFCLA